MFRIRRIYDDVLPINQTAIRDVQQILADQFSALSVEEIHSLPERLRNPFRRRFRTILYVAEKGQGRVIGFAIVLHEPLIGFCFLDFLAAGKRVTGRGVGAALYEYVRDEAVGLKARALLFECLPDEADRCQDPKVRRQNAARLKFYEQYGALPIVNTAYETPVPGGDADNVPHLLFDGLDLFRPTSERAARRPEPSRATAATPPPASADRLPAALNANFLQQAVRAILERKYPDLCPPKYVQQVVTSFQDPLQLRGFRYRPAAAEHKTATAHSLAPLPIAINDRHDIHHIRERGYVEAPVRIRVIGAELASHQLTEPVAVRQYSLRHVMAVHDRDFVDYLKRACENTAQGKSVYPYVFPIRNATRPPKELSIRAGYYCIDTFTPIHCNAFPAARRAVDCALTAADEILRGHRVTYALVRPPGHHAERRSFGGFCYFNNAAVAAHYLSRYGRVAILDIDYHHGNGQQDIFYDRPDVLTVSIHGDPDFAYPYFSGFRDERGVGEGEGFNLNLPLPEAQDGPSYRQALQQSLRRVVGFDPAFLVVALGLDTAKGDPTGTWSLSPKDFNVNGQLLGALGFPTLVVQEGGYRTRTLGVNARHFFQGLVAGASHPAPAAPRRSPA